VQQIFDFFVSHFHFSVRAHLSRYALILALLARILAQVGAATFFTGLGPSV
jgi:hypothetical protein